jgi:hypothetical protein
MSVPMSYALYKLNFDDELIYAEATPCPAYDSSLFDYNYCICDYTTQHCGTTVQQNCQVGTL